MPKKIERPIIQLRPLPEEELKAGFRQAPDSALWRSVLAELDEFIIEVSDRPAAAQVSNDEMRFHLGGQAALVEFRQKLAEREAAARAEDHDEPEPE